MTRIYNQRTKRIKISLTKEEEELFKQLADSKNISVAQLCRTLVNQAQNKDVNDTAKAIIKLEETIDKKLLDFAQSQDIATCLLINNMADFYETKLEKLQSKVEAMAPYYEEAKRVFAANEARKRKERAVNRVVN